MTSSPAQRPQPAFPIDPDAPLFVAKAILASSTMGAVSGAAMGVIRSADPFKPSVSMGINTGIVGVTFFGLREYLVSPLLLSSLATSSYARRLEELSDKQRGKLPASPLGSHSISEIRTERLVDSAVAGGLTGGILSGGLRGPRTIIPAGITMALIATSLQFSVNQLRITRLHLLARSAPQTLPTSNQAQYPNESPIPASSPPQPVSLNVIMDDPTRPIENPENSLPVRIMGFMSAFLPVRKLSDEEYLAALEKKRAGVNSRLCEIAEEEERIFVREAAGNREP